MFYFKQINLRIVYVKMIFIYFSPFIVSIRVKKVFQNMSISLGDPKNNVKLRI